MIRDETELIWTRGFAKSVDKLTVQEGEASSLELMDRAGSLVARRILKVFGRHRNYVVLAGVGNNGGDALRVAWELARCDCSLKVIIVGDEEKQTPEFISQRQRLIGIGCTATHFVEAVSLPKGWRKPVIVDGLLGIGFSGVLREGPVQACLESCSKIADRTVIALDLPSGLDADNWECSDPPLLSADLTLTFGGRKPCHVMSPARNYCGKVEVLEIGFSQKAIELAYQQRPTILARALRKDWYTADLWQHLSPAAHKFDRGHLLVIGGSPGKLGAPVLSCAAALRMGAGWVSLSTPDGYELCQQRPVEVTLEKLFQGNGIDFEKLGAFIEERKVKSMLVGPGMTQQGLSPSHWTELWRLQQKFGFFLVIDAGALTGVCDAVQDGPFLAQKTAITPHPGEWRRLSRQNPIPDLTGIKPLEAARTRLEELGLVAVYKSATPLVFPSPTGLEAIIAGEPDARLAKAGMGDVLAGLTAALGLTGISAFEALAKAQQIIAKSAEGFWDRANGSFGGSALLPSDIIAEICKS